jgi:hypothetical protein
LFLSLWLTWKNHNNRKVIVAFFYFFFYLVFFFIFTGAPDWEKYKDYGRIKTCFWLIVDGLNRFFNLSAGIWTDANGENSFSIPPPSHNLSSNYQQ